MKVRTMGAIVVAIGLIGWLAWLASTGLGFGVEPANEDALVPHLVLALASVLLLTLAYGWTVIFLLVSQRLIERIPTLPKTLYEQLSEPVSKIRKPSVWLCLTGLVFGLVAFVYNAGFANSGHSILVHALLGGVGVVLHPGALALAFMSLRRYDDMLRQLEQELGGAAPSAASEPSS